MASFKVGDQVKVVAREVTSEDTQKGLYYAYFGGLTGTVDRLYDDGSVCVDIELDALTDEMRDRHLAMQEAERKRWLDNLSGEVRNRLSPEQKQLKMSYKILVSKGDLEPNKGGKPRAAKPAQDPAASEENTSSTSENGPAKAPSPEADARRPTEAELAAAEEEYLRSLQKES